MKIITDNPGMQEELDFYRNRLDKVSGEIIRMQYTVASLTSEIRQLQNGFQVIRNLQQSFIYACDLDQVLEQLLDFIVQYMHMERVVLLSKKSLASKTFQVVSHRGFPDVAMNVVKKIRIKISGLVLSGEKTVLVKKNAPASDELLAIGEQFQIPFFAITQLIGHDDKAYILIAGRITERKPMVSYMPLTSADAFIFDAIAGIIGSIDEHLRYQIMLEDERSRISKDMHDDIGSRLSMASLLCNITARNISDRDETSQNLEAIKSTVNDVVDNISNIIWALNPENNSLANLLAYIHEYAGNYLEMNDIDLHFEEQEVVEDYKISSMARKNFFLVTKEALHNIVKHSGATEVHFRIMLEKQILTLQISDNGRGFTAARRFGNGLNNMKKRMEDIRGGFKLHSVKDEGTTLIFTAPVYPQVNIVNSR